VLVQIILEIIAKFLSAILIVREELALIPTFVTVRGLVSMAPFANGRFVSKSVNMTVSVLVQIVAIVMRRDTQGKPVKFLFALRVVLMEDSARCQIIATVLLHIPLLGLMVVSAKFQFVNLVVFMEIAVVLMCVNANMGGQLRHMEILSAMFLLPFVWEPNPLATTLPFVQTSKAEASIVVLALKTIMATLTLSMVD